MKIKIKPKTFGPVFIHIDNAGILQFGEHIEHLKKASVDITSPAITLLYSLGSCIAISIQMIAKGRNIPIEPFIVEVEASKANDMPSRIGRFTLQISGEFVSEASLARDIIGQAKAICTVSNTLNAEINLALKN